MNQIVPHMKLKLVSKDTREPDIIVTFDKQSFHVHDGFLFFKGIKIAVCNYPSFYSSGRLFITKDNVIETYQLDILKLGLNYEINSSVLQVLDNNSKVVKAFTYNEFYAINDGIVLVGNRNIFLDPDGGEHEINFKFTDEIVPLGINIATNTIFCKQYGLLRETRLKINPKFNIIEYAIRLNDGLYCFASVDPTDTVHLFSKLPDDNQFFSEVSKIERVYDKSGDLIVVIGQVFVCKGVIPIKNIILSSSFTFKDKDLVLVVTTAHIFLIYDDFISYTEHSEIIYLISKPNSPNNLPVIHTLTGTIELHSLYHPLTIFTDLPVIFDGLEYFLFELFICTNLGEKYLKSIVKSVCWSIDLETILINVYRLVDDANKSKIDAYIFSQPLLDIQNLKNIIIYKSSYIKLFIEKSIKEQREYEIEDLILHCKGLPIIKDIAYELLQSNCIYLFTLCYPEYEDRFDKNIIKIEKYNLISQRNRNK